MSNESEFLTISINYQMIKMTTLIIVLQKRVKFT